MGFFSGKKKEEVKEESKVLEPKDDLLKDREKLIRVSATFLSKPEVEKESLELRKAFLKRKGLTPDEITQAFDLYKEKKKLEIEEQEMNKELENYKQSGSGSKKDLSKNIERAKQSNFLSLKEFNLKEIPEDVLGLTNLRTLILSSNPLGKIPEEISNLKNLKILHLVNCELGDDSFPESFFSLTQLEELNISMNHISNLVPFFNRFPSIVRLNVSDNEGLSLDELTNMPESIQSISLERNNIGYLPPFFSELPNLKILRLKGNPLDEKMI